MKKILLSITLMSSLVFSAQDECSGLYNAGDYKRSGDCYIKQIKKDNSLINNYYAGDSLRIQGRPKEALPYLQKAEQLALGENDLAFIYNKLSMVYSVLGNQELQLAYNMKYLNSALKRKNNSDIGAAYNNLGLYYSNLDDENKALEYYTKALEYKTENDKAITYNNIALSHRYLGNYDKAAEFYNKAIELNLKNGDYLSLCLAKSNFGAFKYLIENYQEADTILQDANTICHNAGDISTEANSIIYLGFSALKQNNIQLAKSYYNQAKPLSVKSGDTVISTNLKNLENKINSYNK